MPSKASAKAPGKPPTRGKGRPTSYKPEYATQAEKLCKLGATDNEMAAFFNVDGRTFQRWKLDHPELCQSLKVAKAEADERVERSLYNRAVGYTYEAEKVFQYQGEIVRAKTQEHVPPETVACIFWLKNRRPDDWRDKREIHVRTGELEELSAAELGELRSLLTAVQAGHAGEDGRPGAGGKVH